MIKQRILLQQKKKIQMIFAQKMANRNLQGVQWHTEYWELVLKHYHNLDKLEDHRVRYEEALHRARRSLRCRRLWRWAFLRVVQDWLTNDRRFSLNSDRIVAAAVSQDGHKVISITDHGDMCLYVLVPYLMPGWYQDENTERWNKAVEPAVRGVRALVFEFSSHDSHLYHKRITRAATLKCTLKKYENSSRAPRLNTGTDSKRTNEKSSLQSV